MLVGDSSRDPSGSSSELGPARRFFWEVSGLGAGNEPAVVSVCAVFLAVFGSGMFVLSCHHFSIRLYQVRSSHPLKQFLWSGPDQQHWQWEPVPSKSEDSTPGP